MTSLRSTSDPNSEKQSIADKASSCLQAFADLLQKLQTQAEVGGPPRRGSRQEKSDGISLSAVKSESERFRDWCVHNGALKKGTGSLDDSLQLAANTYQIVSENLDDLKESLSEAKDLLDRESSHIGESDIDGYTRTQFKGLENESDLSQIYDCIVSDVNNLERLKWSIEWCITKARLAMPEP